MKNREIKSFNCDNENVDRLVGMIIRSALEDYTMVIPKIKNGISNWQRDKIYKMEYDKATAEVFFRSSTLFEKTGLSLDYLLRAFKEEISDGE